MDVSDLAQAAYHLAVAAHLSAQALRWITERLRALRPPGDEAR
jgi:hypothetical protein